MKIATPRRSPRLNLATSAPTNVAPQPAPQHIRAFELEPIIAALRPTLAPGPAPARAVCHALKLERPLVAWDLETTGVRRQWDQILEFGAVKRFADGRPDEKKLMRFRPTCPISPFAFAAHGIRASELRHEPTFGPTQAKDIIAFLSGCDFVGHNLKAFDMPMLGAALGRALPRSFVIARDWPPADTQILDTLTLFRRFVPNKEAAGGNHKLVTAYAFYMGCDLQHAHSALADSQACMDVVFAMAKACAANSSGGPSGGDNITSVAHLNAIGCTPTTAQLDRQNAGPARQVLYAHHA